MDLSWGEGSSRKLANETGVVAVAPSGTVVDAGWTCRLDQTLAWIDEAAAPDTLLMIDAPLVVTNPRGQRLCETHVDSGMGAGRCRRTARTAALHGSLA